MMIKGIIFIFIAIASTSIWASSDVQYGFGGGLTYFSGTRTQSLAPNSGYFGRFEAGVGSGYVRFTSNFTPTYANATAYFSDSGSENTYSFTMISGEFNAGTKIYFLNFLNKSPMQPYFATCGSVQLVSIKFKENASMSSTWARTESSLFYGYSLAAGVDLFAFKKSGFNFHIEKSWLTGNAGGGTFKISGLRMMLGYIQKIN